MLDIFQFSCNGLLDVNSCEKLCSKYILKSERAISLTGEYGNCTRGIFILKGRFMKRKQVCMHMSVLIVSQLCGSRREYRFLCTHTCASECHSSNCVRAHATKRCLHARDLIKNYHIWAVSSSSLSLSDLPATVIPKPWRFQKIELKTLKFQT